MSTSKGVWKLRPDGVTVRRRNKGRIGAPFVPLIKETLKTPAWKALSYGARALYVVLKWRYNTNLTNAVHVSTRIAAEELGAPPNRRDVCLWFDELEFYGFIVKVRPAHFGVNGHGRAPHWRLTDVKYLGKEPTREFLQWDGTLFARPVRNAGRFPEALKNKSRGHHGGASLAPTGVPYGNSGNGTSGPHGGAMSAKTPGHHGGAITSQPLAKGKEAGTAANGGSDWDTPFECEHCHRYGRPGSPIQRYDRNGKTYLFHPECWASIDTDPEARIGA